MPTSTPSMDAYLLVAVALVGLAVGGFLDQLARRYMRCEPLLRGRDRSDARGRSGAQVTVRHLVTEAACAVIFTVVTLHYGPTIEALEMLAFSCVLVVIALTDLEGRIIPNGCIAAAALIRVAYLVAAGVQLGSDVMLLVLRSLGDAMIVAVPLVLLVLVMDKVLGHESMGGGDVKLLAVCGLFFGWARCVFLLLVACALGIMLEPALGKAGASTTSAQGTAQEAVGQELPPTPRGAFAFGPAIALAAWVTMLCGDTAIGWYLSLF